MMTTHRQPIAADWKISRVLETHPDLLDTLIGLTPAFAKLKNPLLRRVQTRLVTVEQAAGIAGLNPGDLVRQLNEAAGITMADTALPAPLAAPAVTPAAERPAWVDATTVAQEVDARPILARGEEPFGVITWAARQVPVGEVLRLHAGFEPVPLYGALGKQGFEHWTTRQDADHWVVNFFRRREANESSPASSVGPGADWASMSTAEVTIDVSELVPPEPMMKILATLEDLPVGSTLLVHHVRRPIHLYAQLDELGFHHATRDIGPQQVELLIHKPLAVEDVR